MLFDAESNERRFTLLPLRDLPVSNDVLRVVGLNRSRGRVTSIGRLRMTGNGWIVSFLRHSAKKGAANLAGQKGVHVEPFIRVSAAACITTK